MKTSHKYLDLLSLLMQHTLISLSLSNVGGSKMCHIYVFNYSGVNIVEWKKKKEKPHTNYKDKAFLAEVLDIFKETFSSVRQKIQCTPYETWGYATPLLEPQNT